MIDHNAPIPLYYQIREDLLSEICHGKWSVGDMIPSEYQLSQKYGVSRNTAQRAIEELVHQGVLVRKQGLGTFVSSPKIEQGLSGFYSFSRAMQAQGYSTSVKVISKSLELATEFQAKYLEISAGEELFVLKRIRYANNSPIMIDTSRIPVKFVPGIDNVSFEENSLYEILESNFGIFVSRAKEIFEPVLISKIESLYLEVDEKSPAIMLDRIAYSSSNKPIELCRSIVPGNKCRFYTELR